MSGLSDHHVVEGHIERVKDEPVAWRVVGNHVVPVYVYGKRVYETWRDERGQKWGRWTWRYL